MTRTRHERGASMVEAAIALPVVILLTFAGFDGALYMKDYLSASTAARNGARAGAAAGAEAQADFYILQRVQKSAAGAGNVQRIIVYKATTFGAPPSATCSAGTPVSGECNVYEPSDFATPVESFGGGSATFNKDLHWQATTRGVARSTGLDYIGVQIQSTAVTPTGVLGGTSQSVKRHTVLQMEPRRG